MGNIRIVASTLLALTAAACGDDGGGATVDAQVIVDAAPIDTAPTIDSPPAVVYDLSCHGNSAPTTIAPTVTIGGEAQEVNLATMSLGPAAGVSIKACTGNCTGNNNLGTTGPTSANGTFTTAAITTNGAAVDGYLVASKTGQWDTYLYPHAPLAQSLTGAPILMVSALIVSFIDDLLGTPAQTAGNGIVGVAITDCANPPVGIAGATITVTANGAEVGDDPVDASELSDMAAGAFLVTNVPPGTVTITATFMQNGMNYTFLANDVGVVADSVTTAQIKPGY